MIITVTQEDIDNGEMCLTEKCPVALAVKRAIGRMVRVNACYIVADRNYDTPFSASEFIVAFDAGKLVEPFTFEL